MPEEELYDLQNDPWEIDNLAKSDKPEHQAELKKLRAVLEQWIEETNDQGRRFESLKELQATEPRFDPALDWRPPPGSPEAAEAEKLKATGPSKPQATPAKKKRKQLG